MKKIAVAVITLSLVAFVSYKMGYKSGMSQVDAVATENKVKKDLVELTRQDFEEYQTLKSVEDRYKKADEILGKVVTLFLADLGLRLSYKPTNYNELTNLCAPAPTNTQPVAAHVEQPPSPEVKPPTPWVNLENQLLSQTNGDEALNTLKKMEIPDLVSAVQSARPLSAQDVAMIDGKFVGEINFTEKKKDQSDWLMEWEIHQNAQKISTTEGIVILTNKKSGKLISQTKGNAITRDFMKVPGSHGLLVNVRNDKSYIQIYSFDNKNTWLGNYYEKVQLGSYKMTGQVRLSRVN